MTQIKEIYLDNSATTRVHPDVVRSMLDAMSVDYGNPSSMHRKGVEAESLLRRSRETLAKAISVDAGDVFFTSGGTEANNLAIMGAAWAYRGYGSHIVTTAIEHPSVLNACRELQAAGYEVTYVKPDRQGTVSVSDVSEAMRDDTILVSVMHVNNEVGSVQPIYEIGDAVRRRRDERNATRSPSRKVRPVPIYHVDAVQSFLKLPVDPGQAGADLVTFSAHKIHGPKGVGAIYVRRGVRLRPLVYGGGQEQGLRSGTENVPGIVGFGKAVETFLPHLAETARRLRRLKEKMANTVLSALPEVTVNGPPAEEGAPHIISLSFPWVRGETLVHHLESRGIYVSSGSACSSRDPKPSHVLTAMGLDKRRIEGAIRISLGFLNEPEDVDTASRLIVETAAELRGLFAAGGKRKEP